MIIFDSNIWVGFFDEDDSNHQKAKQVFNTTQQKVFVTEYIILETTTILAQKKSKEAANEFLEKISVSDRVEVFPSSKKFLDEVVNFYLSQKDRNLSFVDYSLLFLSQKAKVVTFDKRLKKEIEKLA